MKIGFLFFLIVSTAALSFHESLLFGKPANLKVYPIKKTIEVKPGESGTIPLKFEIPYHSYIYANPKGPGTGKPTIIKIIYPENFLFYPTRFMAPQKYIPAGETDFVWIYEKETTADIPFSVKKESMAGEYKITINIDVLLCTSSTCTPQNFAIDYRIRVDDPVNPNLYKSPFFNTNTNLYNISINKNESLNNNPGLLKRVSLFKPKFLSVLNIGGIISAIFYGFLAGFILNFMPCVLPVISLKILDIIKHSGHDKKNIKKQGLVFSLGILSSFVIIAFLFSFMEYTWGGLFEKNLFLIIMITVVFILALSLFEVFTINIPQFAANLDNRIHHRRSTVLTVNIPGYSEKKIVHISNKYLTTYAKGILATLLATPCSGPFLGGTLAWTSGKPLIVVFIVFVSIGVGMSLPYIILTLNPVLMKFIPKSGNWMIILEKIIAFMLLGTCLYLASILKENFLMPMFIFLLVTAFAFWQYGRFGSIINTRSKRIISGIVLILIMLGGYFLSFRILYPSIEKPAYSESDKKNFTIDKLFENRDKRIITIVNFTADWCPNCKFVEKTSLFAFKVIKIIEDNNIELLTADMTEENPEAKALLNQLGSRSIPFLAVIPAGDAFYNPICLRDIYSQKDILDAIDFARKKSGKDELN